MRLHTPLCGRHHSKELDRHSVPLPYITEVIPGEINLPTGTVDVLLPRSCGRGDFELGGSVLPWYLFPDLPSQFL
jgi:hypothetical protein